MAIETAIVSAQAISGAGTQDFTSSGFGTPQAVMLIAHHGVTADSDTDLSLAAYGFYDGTNQSCSSTSDIHGSTATASRVVSDTFNTHIYNAYEFTYSGARTATASLITDGVRLTWSDATSRPYVTIILIKGATAAFAGTYAPAGTADTTVDVTTTGCDPNTIINAGAGTNTINAISGVLTMSLGFATSRGSITQASIRYSGANSINTAGSTAVYDGYIATTGTSTVESAGIEITAMGTGQFTATTRSLESTLLARQQAFLALQVDTAPDVFVGTTPTSGDWTPYTGSFEPSAVLMATSALTAVRSTNHTESGSACYGAGFYVVNSAAEIGNYNALQDDAATTNVSGRRSSALIIQENTGGTPVFSAASPTFTSTGLTYGSANITHGASGYKVVGFALPGSTVRMIPVVQPLYYGSQPLENKTGIFYKVTAGHTTLGGSLLAVGTDGTTDASGNFVLPAAVSLEDEGGAPAEGDPITLHLYWEEGTDPIVDRSIIIQTTATEDV